MEYQKVINLLYNTPNTYNEVHKIRFKTSILRSSLCDYSDAYILIKGTTTVAKETDAVPSNPN